METLSQYIERLATEMGYRFTADKDAEISFIRNRAGYDIADANESRQGMGKPLLTRDEMEPIYKRNIAESMAFFGQTRIMIIHGVR